MKWLQRLFGRQTREVTHKQTGVQWDALQRLQREGSITAWKIQRMGTTLRPQAD